nr:hypothetical protein [Streptomyces cyaneofuscatus]
MGVREVVVDPVPLGQALDVQLTQTDDGVLLLAVLALVAVDVQRLGELVVVPALLELLEGRGDDVGVHHAVAGGRVGGGPQLGVVARGGLARVVLHHRVVDVVRIACRVDVLLDEGRFLGLLVRLDLELLHDRRVEPADQDRREHHQAEADDRQLPGAAPQRREEQHGTDRRDEEQDGLRREIGVRVDEPQAGPVVRGLEVTGLHREAVPVEPVGHGLQGDEDAEQHREMTGGRGGGAGAGAGDAQPAVQIVGQGGGDQREHGRREAEAQQEAVPRQVEGVEGDVQLELGVLRAERHPVDVHQPGAPLAGGGCSGDQSDERGDGEQHPLLEGGDAHPVAVQALLFQRHRAQRRPQPVREPDVHADGQGHQQPEDEEQSDLGPQGGGEDGGIRDRPVPEPVRPEPGEHDEGHGENRQDPQGHEQGADAPGRAADTDPWPGRASAAVRHLESQRAHLEVRGRVERAQRS